jgi:DNA primase
VETDRLRAAHRAAEAFYQAQRFSPEANAYLRSRGIPPALARAGPWRLGFAPPGRASLTEHLARLGFAASELGDAGLASARGVDVFRNRVMFPIRDEAGSPAGFVGRDISGNRRVPRYRNTKTTPLYVKSKQLYGLYEASASANTVLIVEGPADVVALSRLPAAQAGRWSAVSPCGTALTSGQLDQLAANLPVDTALALCFDPDTAGRRALIRAYRLLTAWSGPVDAIVLPPGRDPAALIARSGPRVAGRMLERARRPLLAALVDQRLAGRRLDEIEGRVTALRSAGCLLRRAADEVPRDVSLLPAIGRDLSLRLGFDGVTVLEAIFPP